MNGLQWELGTHATLRKCGAGQRDWEDLNLQAIKNVPDPCALDA
jgi:hypothetical protein